MSNTIYGSLSYNTLINPKINYITTPYKEAFQNLKSVFSSNQKVSFVAKPGLDKAKETSALTLKDRIKHAVIGILFMIPIINMIALAILVGIANKDDALQKELKSPFLGPQNKLIIDESHCNQRIPKQVFDQKHVTLKGLSTIPNDLQNLDQIERIEFQNMTIDQLPEWISKLEHLRELQFEKTQRSYPIGLENLSNPVRIKIPNLLPKIAPTGLKTGSKVISKGQSFQV